MARCSALRKQVLDDNRWAPWQARPGDSRDPGNGAQPSSWATVPDAFRRAGGPLPPPWEELFGPLRQGGVDGLVVVGQCGQSIDARIATPTGHSHYINGEAGLAHLHRLRALVDAVVVGVGTAIKDDPLLTVRRVEGPSPARVIVDPNGRLPPTARVLADDGIRRLVITGPDARGQLPVGVERVAIGPHDGQLAPAAIIAALASPRLPPHSDRRRRRYGVALCCRPLSRPAARRGRSDHSRRGTIEPHAAADRSR